MYLCKSRTEAVRQKDMLQLHSVWWCQIPVCHPEPVQALCRSSSGVILLHREQPAPRASVQGLHSASQEWQPSPADLPLEMATSQSAASLPPKESLHLLPKSSVLGQSATPLLSLWSCTCFSSFWSCAGEKMGLGKLSEKPLFAGVGKKWEGGTTDPKLIPGACLNSSEEGEKNPCFVPPLFF